MYVIHAYDPRQRPLDLAGIPVVAGDAVKLAWVDHWWDGPLEGVCDWEGRRVWFQYYYDPTIDDSDCDERELAERDPLLNAVACSDPPRRVLLLHELSPAQLAEECKWHNLFVEHVGSHWDFTLPEDTPRGPATGSMSDFYEPYQRERPTLDLSRMRVLAVWIQ